MAKLQKRRATYQDLLRLPENLVGEIIDGDLIVSPRPAMPHAIASSTLGADLLGPFQRKPGGGGPGGWWIVDEPELHLSGNVLVPDLAGWRRERMPRIPQCTGVKVPPDWICEVLSSSTVAFDRGRKMATYARAEVPHLWLLDPLARTLEVYRLQGAHWLLQETHVENARVRIEPFEAVELDLSRWWLEPEPPLEPPEDL
jgi:Uma2 family endonuclease